jgi:hypothetical protein
MRPPPPPRAADHRHPARAARHGSATTVEYGSRRLATARHPPHSRPGTPSGSRRRRAVHQRGHHDRGVLLTFGDPSRPRIGHDRDVRLARITDPAARGPAPSRTRWHPPPPGRTTRGPGVGREARAPNRQPPGPEPHINAVTTTPGYC